MPPPNHSSPLQGNISHEPSACRQDGRDAKHNRSRTGGKPTADHKRTRSKRGEKLRPPADKAPGQQGSSGFNSFQSRQQSNLEPVAPLQVSSNRWDRKALSADTDSLVLVDRKVRSLLNKLTMEKFDSISDQIITWANKSQNERDGRTLNQVIRLVFENAVDQMTWSEMYARLCRKMMEQISPKVQDYNIKNNEGKPIAGGQLFRKHLLNRCKEDFEQGYRTQEDGKEEAALYSDEYYAAQKAKRRGLGIIKFIGELFKLQMLTERIMHESVKKLLGNADHPEQKIESICKLLTTVGVLLDTVKARAHLDVYFSKMKELTKTLNVSLRMQFMLQDLIELRERKWVARRAIATPTTIAQIHEAAAKEKAAQEKKFVRPIGMSGGGSKRRGDRGDYPQAGPDGWDVDSSSSAPRPPSKQGDLSNFGKISKAGPPTTFGPSSVFAGKKGAERRESTSQTASNSNMFTIRSSQRAEASEPEPVDPQRKHVIPQPPPKSVEASEMTEKACRRV